MNKVILIGNLGQDPEVKMMQSGTKVANFSLATSEHWKDKNGERKESVEWHRIVIYGDKLPEIIEKYAKKGSKVYVEGSIRSRKYTDSSGNERTAFEIVVQGYGATVKILDSKAAIEEGGGKPREIDSGSGQAYRESDRIDQSIHIDDEVPF